MALFSTESSAHKKSFGRKRDDFYGVNSKKQ